MGRDLDSRTVLDTEMDSEAGRLRPVYGSLLHYMSNLVGAAVGRAEDTPALHPEMLDRFQGQNAKVMNYRCSNLHLDDVHFSAHNQSALTVCYVDDRHPSQ